MNRELVDVKAIVSLEYDGRAYRPGDWFKASAVDALTMAGAGRVSCHRDYSTKAAIPVEPRRPQPAAKSKRGTYQRRDMVAEGARE